MNELNDFKQSPLLNAQFAVTDETIYVSACSYNGLYAIDIVSGRLRFIGKFLNQGNFDTFMFEVKQYGNKLVFVPGCAQEIAFYDLETKQIEEVSMEHVFSTNTIVMSAYTVVDDILYLFPAQATSIICYDMNTKDIIDVIDIADIYKRTFGMGYVALSAATTIYRHKNQVYIPCWMHSAFMSFDLESRNIAFYQAAGCGQGFCALCGVGDTIYALGRNGMLIQWDVCSKEVLDKKQLMAVSNRAEEYRKMVIVGEQIYLMSDGGILKLIKTDLRMQTEREGLSKEVLDKLGKECTGETIYVGCTNDEKAYCYTDKNRYFCMDLKSETVEWVRSAVYDSDALKKIIYDDTGIRGKGKVIQETDAIDLHGLMEMVCSGKEMEKRERRHVGDKIYRTILSGG